MSSNDIQNSSAATQTPSSPATPMGYSKTSAVADNRTREGRRQNRRVEVKVLANRGMARPANAARNP